MLGGSVGVSAWVGAPSAYAQRLTEGIEQHYELQLTASEGRTPLWLQANRYGLGSLSEVNGYVRGAVLRPVEQDSLRRWGMGYGADLALTQGYEGSNNRLVVQQLYAEVRYGAALLTLGQKEQPLELKPQELSSGSQTLGINARPTPGVRLSLPDYWALPKTGGWLALKGHLSYGMMTDGGWQERWTRETSHYAKQVMLHTKAGYLRIGPDDEVHRYSLEMGLEMACQFGGTMYHTQFGTVEGARGMKAYWNALIGGGSDEVDATYHNVGGNQLGSWVARVNYQWGDGVRLSVYADHFFEDHSSMLLLDYDGYGEGEEWNLRKENRYLLYGLKDGLLGAELRLLRCPWLSDIVIEYMNTRYQSGPIYHDHNPGLSDHIGGDDNYYNHYLYQGWSHWGQVMGNPLYRSPLYNDDATLTIGDNRFYGWHMGLKGGCERVDYRLLASWQRGYGTYQHPLLTPADNLSMMAEATMRLPERWGRGWLLRAALGLDHGALLGNNAGGQLTLIYHLKD